MKRIYWIDIAKGIGIFLVVLGHCQITGNILDMITTFHMPLFFFLSGYLFHPKNHTLYSFGISRIKTIIVPYVVFTLLSICASFSRNLIGQNITVSEVFDGFIEMGTVESNRPLWFLRSLFVVALCFFYVPKLQRHTAADFAAVYLVFILTFGFDWSFYMRSVNGLLFYALGYLMHDFHLAEKIEKSKYLVCLASGTGLLLSFQYTALKGYELGIASHDYLIPFLLVTHFGILFVVSLSMCISHNRILEYMGKNSLVILCTHILIKDVMSILLKLLWKKENYMDEVSNGNAVVTSVAIILCACILAGIINRYVPFVLGRTKKMKHAQ